MEENKQKTRYRVWPDGTVQLAEDPPHTWMSDDYQEVLAVDEEEAMRLAM